MGNPSEEEQKKQEHNYLPLIVLYSGASDHSYHSNHMQYTVYTVCDQKT